MVSSDLTHVVCVLACVPAADIGRRKRAQAPQCHRPHAGFRPARFPSRSQSNADGYEDDEDIDNVNEDFRARESDDDMDIVASRGTEAAGTLCFLFFLILGRT